MFVVVSIRDGSNAMHAEDKMITGNVGKTLLVLIGVTLALIILANLIV